MHIRGFIKVLRRFQLGKLSQEENQLLNEWYRIISKKPVERNSKEEIKERIWMNINRAIVTNQLSEHRKTPSLFKEWGHYFYITAVLLFLLLINSYVFTYEESNKVQRKIETYESQNWKEVVNDLKIPKEIVLSDGSRVLLEPGSRLSYPFDYGSNQRVVKLIGNGLFDVKKDAKRPFLVYSGSILTRVIGTSFTIKQQSETNAIEVAVLTGKVIVEKNISSKKTSVEKVMLTANKKVTFFENSDRYTYGLVDQPIVIKNNEEALDLIRFNFDETHLQEVLNQLESAYGIEIVLSNDRMLDCPITADLSTDNLYEKIELIGAILNAHYQIIGTTILLIEDGCN